MPNMQASKFNSFAADQLWNLGAVIQCSKDHSFPKVHLPLHWCLVGMVLKTGTAFTTFADQFQMLLLNWSTSNHISHKSSGTEKPN